LLPESVTDVSGLTVTHVSGCTAPKVEFGGVAGAAAQRDAIEPLTADLRRLHITVSREFLRDLETARDGLSHATPNATTEQVLHSALQMLLEKQARARGLVKKPSAPTRKLQEPSPPLALVPAEPPPSRRDGPREAIPVAVRRAVWQRDAGRCSWPLDSGGCCGSTHRLELDHIIPWAEWGPSTEENLRVVCHRHNAFAARRSYGSRWMARYDASRADDGAG
jgi:hypothetical protein